MKQPSLEEVKEYFKNAKEVICLFDKKVYDITNSEIISDGEGRFQASFEDGRYCRLQKYNTEYAEILTYKEKTFSITESQIKELEKNCDFDGRTKLKEWFSEVFKIDLEIGKWYISDTYLICKQEGCNCFGFYLPEMSWIEKVRHDLEAHLVAGYGEAAESEVFEALKNEAVKRGFVGNQYVDITTLGFFNDKLITGGQIEWKEGYLNFGDKQTAIFKNGVWGKVLDSITLSEAEQQLKKKIIV